MYNNWYVGFLDRHPQLRARYIPPLDKERVLAEDPSIITAYFNLFVSTMAEYKIHLDDVYNMDKKGYMMGVIRKFRAIVARSQKDAFMAQPGTREWVSLIECVCSTGRVLSGWVIFKGKNMKKEWLEHFPKGHICTSERGWTDNELCVAWFKQCFEPETRSQKKGVYRMLIFDGHGSHVTKEVMEFC